MVHCTCAARRAPCSGLAPLQEQPGAAVDEETSSERVIPPEAVPNCYFWEFMRRDALVCCMQVRRVEALTA